MVRSTSGSNQIFTTTKSPGAEIAGGPLYAVAIAWLHWDWVMAGISVIVTRTMPLEARKNTSVSTVGWEQRHFGQITADPTNR